MKKPLAVYIHWGFCRRKCPYCDFISRKLPPDTDFTLWLEEYKKSFLFYAASADSCDFYISSIYFGGGTPSLLPAWFIEQLIAFIGSIYTFSSNIEITLEANPYLLSKSVLTDFKKAGINRLSLGVQSLSDTNLQFLGRLHSASQAISALEIIKNTFDNFSFDLIYALPSQTADSWEKELAFALSFAPPHLSCYQLTIEPPSRFYRQNVKGADEDLALTLWNITLDLTSANNIPAYEVSNHAKTGFESRHNLSYWEYQDYIGIGPSACGRISCKGLTLATKEKISPLLWKKAKIKNAEMTALNPEEVREEKILMGLRLKKGISSALITNKQAETLLLKQGLIAKEHNKIHITRQGLFVLDKVIEAIV